MQIFSINNFVFHATAGKLLERSGFQTICETVILDPPLALNSCPTGDAIGF